MFRVLSLIYFFVVVHAGITRRSIPAQLQGRIVGGQPTDISRYPYQASFEFLDSHFCGASVVSEYWVVTAAHCIDQADVMFITIRVGSTTITTGGDVHEATQTKPHPNFDYYTLDNDIALIKVSEPFVYSTVVQPIQLVDSEPTAGSIAVTTGWGTEYSGGRYSTVLQQVSIPIVDHEECNTAYYRFGGIGPTMLCAGEDLGKKDTCQGDSGGPLVVAGKLVGIASWGAGCGVRGYPGIYADVALLRDFVISVLEEN